MDVDVRDGADRPELRGGELVAITATWFFGLSAVAGFEPTTWLPIASVLAGVTASLTVSLPLSPWATNVPRTATARRVTEAAFVATTMAAIPLLLVTAPIHPVVVLALGLISWVIVAVSTFMSPMRLAAPERRPSVMSDRRRTTRLERALKRLMDVVGSTILLLVTSPILLVAAALIRKHDRGPVFFRQERMAQGTGTFRIYKFRSMVMDAEELKDDLRDQNERTGPLFKLSEDPRVTPIGKALRALSIDELPQLINVLKGEMSLVGPRPALVDEAEVFDDELALDRASVRPGITGLWQAEARNDPDFARYRSLDLNYVRNWSLGLDMRILMATVAEILTDIVAVPLRALGMRNLIGGDTIDHHHASDIVIDLRDAKEPEPQTETETDAVVIDLNMSDDADVQGHSA